jgi:NagD protein
VKRRDIDCWLTDMDGVLVSEDKALPGAAELIEHWRTSGTHFLVLTNNSTYTPRDLSARLVHSGIEVPEHKIWTSALATAAFLADQVPQGSVFVIGEAGLTTACTRPGSSCPLRILTSWCLARPGPIPSRPSPGRSG